MGAEEGFDNFYSICGFMGGVVFAVSLLPQIWKTYSTKSSLDLSYFWQITYLVGLIGLGVYAIAYALWPVLAPGIVDFALMFLLTFMKYYYDNIYPRKQAKIKERELNATPVKEGGDAEEGAPVLHTVEVEPITPSQGEEGVSLREGDAADGVPANNGHAFGEGTRASGEHASDKASQPLKLEAGEEGNATGEQHEMPPDASTHSP